MVTASVTSRCPGRRDDLTAIGGTLVFSIVILFYDGVLYGSYTFSVLPCPIWFVASVIRTVVRRPSFGVAAARLLIPLAAFLLVVANHSVQNRIARGNAERLI